MLNKILTKYSFVIVLLLLIGCDHASDCIKASSPVLPPQTLAEGTLHLPYSQTIDVGMSHANASDYMISAVDIKGQLPDGIDYVTSGMQIVLSGTPARADPFEFTITVTVRPYKYPEEGGDGLCGNQATKIYNINIKPF